MRVKERDIDIQRGRFRLDETVLLAVAMHGISIIHAMAFLPHLISSTVDSCLTSIDLTFPCYSLLPPTAYCLLPKQILRLTVSAGAGAEGTGDWVCPVEVDAADH